MTKEKLKAENEKLKAALRFYANEDWDEFIGDALNYYEFPGLHGSFGDLFKDQGKKASEALKED